MVTQTNSMLINQELLKLLQECQIKKCEVGSSAGGGGGRQRLQRFKCTNHPGRAIQTQCKQTFIFRHWSIVYQQGQKKQKQEVARN
jgi:hypothetical protein